MALKYIDRRGTDSVKWDDLIGVFGDPDLLAMWVADMDFDTAPCIKGALKEFIDSGPFGYYLPREEYYEAFMTWEKERHGYEIDRNWICFAPSVVKAFYWIALMATQPGDSMLLLTPVYYPMIQLAADNNRKLVCCDLIKTGNSYDIDFDDFEKKIIENEVRLFILCSPHNPVGRVWTEEELGRMMEICRAHKVLVISDEIHQEFIYGARKHVPTATVGDYDSFLITLYSASKAFNLAACQNAFVIIPNEELRARYKDFLKRLAVKNGNPFGYIAAEAAFTGGAEWLNEVNEQIWENYVCVRDIFKEEIPKVGVADLQGTYLLWLDFSEYFTTQEEVIEFMQDRCGLAFDYGSWFGGEAYIPYVRMNLATSRENVETAAAMIISEIKKLEAPASEEELI